VRHSPDKEDSVLDGPSVQALGEAVVASELSAEQRASIRHRIFARLADRPPPLTETVRTGSIAWRQVGPGVKAKLLKRDDDANVIIVLWQLEPGGRLAHHSHEESEECLVLEGEMLVGEHRVAAGELHIAHRGSMHDDLTTRTGCLLMVRSGISPLLKSLFQG
jgi:quercetin dioxygenase-like cupin family protein